MAFPGFPAPGIKLLADLRKHNDREWFQPRKEIYEQAVKLPMIDLIAELNRDLGKVAPDHVVEAPEKAVSRIYRDVRFAKDKSPYKTNVYGVWRHRAAAKGEAASFYVSVSGKAVEVGGGVWMPPPPLLAAVRGWIGEHHDRLKKILASPRMKKMKQLGLELYTGDTMARVPRGFDADHPAAEWLKLKHFIVMTELPVKVATTPALHKQIAGIFGAIAPFIAALDEAAGV